MGRISNTIGLAKVSWGVLCKGRVLLVLPVLSFLVPIVVPVALGAVLQAAFYLYATTGNVPSGFEQSTLPESFCTR